MWALLAAALLLSLPALAGDAPAAPAAPVDPNAPVVEAVSEGVWRVTVTCGLGSESRTGSVMVAGQHQPELDALPHTGLARARACLALSQVFRDKKDWSSAVMVARSGINALGVDYATPGSADETRLALRAAEDAAIQGSPMKGADAMIGVLTTRIGMYERSFAGALAEGG